MKSVSRKIAGQDLRAHISEIPDFPRTGVLFRDISPLLRQHFAETLSQMSKLLTRIEWDKIDLIGGIESRGFILAAGLAAKHEKGFVTIRKRGKLPGPVITRCYSLEEGKT
jgi:adenine phosphoribosyltransferase